MIHTEDENAWIAIILPDSPIWTLQRFWRLVCFLKYFSEIFNDILRWWSPSIHDVGSDHVFPFPHLPGMRRQRGSPPCDGWSSAAVSGYCSGCPSEQLSPCWKPSSTRHWTFESHIWEEKSYLILQMRIMEAMACWLVYCHHVPMGPKSPIMDSRIATVVAEISKLFHQNKIPHRWRISTGDIYRHNFVANAFQKIANPSNLNHLATPNCPSAFANIRDNLSFQILLMELVGAPEPTRTTKH